MSPRRAVPLTVSLLLLPLAACSAVGDDGTPAPMGAVIATSGYQIEGFPSYVVVPGRRFDFIVSSPRDSMDTLDADNAGYDDEAADGRAFVGVRWDLEAVPGDASLAMAPADVPVVATLVVDGERRDLGDLREGSGSAYVVVPADPDDVEIEVAYDGQTQVVDVYDPVLHRPAGLDALYNDASTFSYADCPDTPRYTRGFSWPGGSCTTALTSPVLYYGPAGWAPTGSEWVVVTVTVSGATGAGIDVPGGFLSYDVTGGDARLTLDGAEPEQLLPIDEGDAVGLQDDGDWRAVAVFRVDESDTPRELVIARGYQAIADGDEAEAAGQPRARTLRDRVVVSVY